jgi:hypothetical protein
MQKLFQVGVFTEFRDGRKPLISAYTTWFNPEWEGCCVHGIRANSGAEAKKMAIEDHKKRCLDKMEAKHARREGI